MKSSPHSNFLQHFRPKPPVNLLDVCLAFLVLNIFRELHFNIVKLRIFCKRNEKIEKNPQSLTSGEVVNTLYLKTYLQNFCCFTSRYSFSNIPCVPHCLGDLRISKSSIPLILNIDKNFNLIGSDYV